ncbi:hypothetical protein B0O80DRAFT_180503 [Mortierella sp. GBAus27b]|nr:hypothetical protein BGX31_002245 [Mortierella sp. GBA43]KAI8348567.1 hypothetical protein B0O80DRAFT_180503 [Mortierella sp. GBAus27b]
MNTVRTPSRNSNTSSSSSTLTAKSQNAPPKKAKVLAQMDYSSLPFTGNNLPATRTSILSSTVYQQPSPSQQKHPAPPAPTIKVRSSSSVPTTNTIKATQRGDASHVRISNGGAISSGGTSGSTGGGHAAVRRIAAGSGTISRSNSTIKVRSEGSVTSSDDGTVSEDSVEDHIQLFSGIGAGGLLVNSLFGASSTASSRAGSAIGSTMSSGPKIASGASTPGRTRVASSASLSAPITVPTAKPMRIAPGAAIRVDSPESLTGAGGSAAGSTGVLSTSVSSSTSSSSLSWVSSPPQKQSGGAGDRDSNGSIAQPSSPTAATSTAPFSSPSHTSNTGATTPAAVAAKQAEESRRTEEAARTRRKIQDLEISNTSLLQVNKTLETTIRKQAAEIQELKTRMQSSQFGGDLSILSSDVSTPLAQENGSDPSNQINGDANPETAGIIHEMTETERQADITFRRLCMTIEQLIFEAKQALDQSMKPAGVKVLSSFDMFEKEDADDDMDIADQSMVTNEDDIDGHFDDSDNDNDL